MITFFKLLKQAFRSIFNNKARSFLTMLGIAIAVFVVVAVNAISNGLAQSTTERFSNLDATRITITSQQVTEETDEENTQQDPGNTLRSVIGGGNEIPAGSESLTEDDLGDVIAIPNITNASPVIAIQDQTELLDGTTTRLTINGVSTSYEGLEELTLDAGQFFTQAQQESSENIIVTDYSLATGLFDTSVLAIGQKVTFSDVEYTIVGVLVEPEEEAVGFGGPGGGGGQRSTAYVPYTTVMKNGELEKISSIIAETTDEDSVEPAAEAILAALYGNHEISEEDSDVTITTSADAISTISGITAAQSKSDKFIGWIVLLVGGIGIMNIMLVTVSERTKEIGLRKAVGAKGHHIIVQFLTESILLTAIGGGIGLLLASVFSGQVTKIFEIQSTGPGRTATDAVAIVDTNTILVAIGASVLAGIVFGLYPAIKAARKEPVEALRYE